MTDCHLIGITVQDGQESDKIIGGQLNERQELLLREQQWVEPDVSAGECGCRNDTRMSCSLDKLMNICGAKMTVMDSVL